MAGVKIGNTTITNFKLGNTQINKIYLGASLLWEFDPPDPVDYAAATSAFMDAHPIPNDGTLYAIGTDQQITGAQLWSAVEEIVLSLIDESFWNDDRAYWLFLPGQTTIRNLKNPVEMISFPNGLTANEVGAALDGINQYGNSGIDLADFTAGDISFGVYMRDASDVNQDGTVGPAYMGTTTDNVQSNGYGQTAAIAGIVTNYISAARTDGFVSTSVEQYSGSQATILYNNGLRVGAGVAVHGASSGILGIGNILNGAGAPAGNYNPNTYSFGYLGKAKTDFEMRKLYGISQVFQYRLKRAIEPLVLIDGDSNSTGVFAGGGDYTKGWPYQLDQMTMPDRHTITVGEGSAQASTVVANMATKYPGRVNVSSIYVLMIGGNDLSTGVSVETCYGNVLTAINYVKSLGCIKIILCTYPAFEGVSGDVVSKHTVYNQTLRDNALAEGWVVADIIDVIPTHNATDFVDDKHFSEIGCGKIATKVNTTINLF